TPGGSAYTVTGSTLSFNGSAAQSVSGFATFNNLTISNAAGVTLAASSTVNGSLTLTSGALGIGANTLTLNGAVTAGSGSITSAAAGTVLYNQGANGQGVVAGTYGNLTFSDFNKTLAGAITVAGTFSPGAALGATTTVGGTLALTAGNVTTGPNTLELAAGGSVARTAGQVVGNLQKVIGTGASSATFEIGSATAYAPVNVSFGNVTTSGTLTASTTSGDHPSIGASAISSGRSVNRYWTLGNGGT